MAHNNTVLGQMLQLLPRHIFEHQVETHAWQGPKPRKLSYWSQLVAMLYAQLSGKKSLRDLVFSLGRHQQKLYHLGLAPGEALHLGRRQRAAPRPHFCPDLFQAAAALGGRTAPATPDPTGSKSWTPPTCRCVTVSSPGPTLCQATARSSCIFCWMQTPALPKISR